MKMIKYSIPVVVALFLVAGLVKTAINNPPIVQASRKEASPTDKITDRRAFMEGTFLVEDIRLEGQRAARRKDILAGVEGVSVLVEALHPCAEQYGLTRQVLQTDTELRLRMHGIKVGTDMQTQNKKLGERNSADIAHSSFQNWQQAIDAESDEDFLQFARESVRRDLFTTYTPPRLYINLATIVFEESGRAAYSIRVELNETAYMSRNGAFCSAPAWCTSYVGACSSSDLKENVRECLRDCVDEFINAYLAANPKDRSSEETQ